MGLPCAEGRPGVQGSRSGPTVCGPCSSKDAKPTGFGKAVAPGLGLAPRPGDWGQLVSRRALRPRFSRPRRLSGTPCLQQQTGRRAFIAAKTVIITVFAATDGWEGVHCCEDGVNPRMKRPRPALRPAAAFSPYSFPVFGWATFLSSPRSLLGVFSRIPARVPLPSWLPYRVFASSLFSSSMSAAVRSSPRRCLAKYSARSQNQ